MPTPIRTYRTKNITISLPKPDSYSWIEVVLQELFIDAETGRDLQLVDDVERINKRADTVYTQIVDYVEPLTGEAKQISIGGLSRAIKSAVVAWATENGDKVYNEKYDIIVDK